MRVRTYARRYGLVLLCAYACLCVGAVVLVGMWVGGCSCIPQGNTIGDLRATAVSILPNAELIAAGIWLTGLTRSSMGFRSDYKSQQGLELPSLLLARSRGGGKHTPLDYGVRNALGCVLSAESCGVLQGCSSAVTNQGNTKF